MRDIVNSPHYHVPVEGVFTQSVRVKATTNLLFLSGITARDARGEVQGLGYVEEQTRVVLRQMDQIITAAGGTMAGVVKVLAFVRRADDIPAVGKILRGRLGNPPPASTIVEVSRLFDPDQLIEIEAVVALPD